MRILGVDYGDKRTGLAVSDITQLIASPLRTVTPKSMRECIDVIASEADKQNAMRIVIGLPINMDGTEGERASKTRALGRNLEKVTGIEVVYHDERLSSVTAENILIESRYRREERKKIIDTVAAQIILQSYLDTLKR